jgi:undecaprenyl-phosphate galactose phosphotransferase/putative colanic acid biosynthesis UDP-glucose lipid carrier transferase
VRIGGNILMSESDIRHETGHLGDSLSRSPVCVSGDTIPYLLSIADGLSILLSSLVGGIGYQLSLGYPAGSALPYLAVGVLASFIHILRMGSNGYYAFPDSAKPRVETGDILFSWSTTALLLALLAFLLKIGGDYSRGSFVLFCFLAPIGLLGVRKLTKIALVAAVSRKAIGRRHTVLIGEFDEMNALERQDLLTLFGSVEVNRFTLGREDNPSARASADVRIINSVAEFVRRHNCREILLALPWSDTRRIEFVRNQIKPLPVSARLLPDMNVRSLTNYSSSERQRALTIELQSAPLSEAQRFVKRSIDILMAVMALIFFSPVMALTAIAIKLDSPGPVVFRQHRKGFNGQQFVIFKFRTMTVQENGPAVAQATRDDPRVTDIGRLLRSASIDELPQFLNVLKGDMSVVGPRPHALAHDNHFENILSDYAFRHHVKPGITGWAQCNGARGATPSIEHISERVRLDLWYINNWSLWLDMQILIKTFFEVMQKRNAY